jgi:hypothetical protein
MRRGRACSVHRNNPSVHPALLLLRSCRDVRPPHRATEKYRPEIYSRASPQTHSNDSVNACVFDRSNPLHPSLFSLVRIHPCWIRMTARCFRPPTADEHMGWHEIPPVKIWQSELRGMYLGPARGSWVDRGYLAF